jgi:hypothetical protein
VLDKATIDALHPANCPARISNQSITNEDTMSQTTLQSVTLETLATAAKTAEHAVEVYRAGGRRLVAVIDERVTGRAVTRAERFAPKLAAALRRSGDRAGKLVVKGIEVVSQRTDALIAASSARMAAQVRRLARAAGGVRNPFLASSLHTAARLTMPGAKVALAITERVAAVADKLPMPAAKGRKAPVRQAAKRVAQPAVRRAAAKPVAEPLKKVTQRAGTQVRRAVKKAVVETQAAVKPVVRAARKQAKAVAKPVTAAVQAAQDAQA